MGGGHLCPIAVSWLPPARGRSPLLICPDKSCLSQAVSLHGLLEHGFAGPAEIGEQCVERIQFEKIAMTPDWRARSPVAGAMPIVGAFERAARQRRAGDALGESGCIRRDVVEDPMD